jgi:hypothetical protein
MYDLVNEELFDLKKSQEYILSIQVSLSGFSFSVICPADNKLLAFKTTQLKNPDEESFTQQFEEWFDSHEIFLNSFKKIRIIVFSENFSLVPEKFISEEIKRNVQTLLFSEKANTEVTERHMKLLDSKLIFGVPKGLKDLLKQKLKSYQLIHPIELIIRNLPDTTEKYGLALLFNSKNLYVVLSSDNSIRLVNCFKINHPNDVIYHALASLKQSDFSPKKTEIYYSGEIDNEKEILTQFEKYFYSVKPLSGKKLLELNSEDSNQLVHRNLTLYY